MRAVVIAAVAVTLISCASASSGSLRVAREAETAQNYDLAVAEYTKLLRNNPNSRDARVGLCGLGNHAPSQARPCGPCADAVGP